MSDLESQLIVRCGEGRHGPYRTDITPESAGWSWSGVKILVLPPRESLTVATAGEEFLVLPLAGACNVTVDGDGYALRGRESVFTEVTDHLYLPPGTTFTISSEAGGRFAVPTARARRGRPVSYGSAAEVRTELRGGGANSRQVNSYTVGNRIETEHLLVCEVLTPSGCWSSYPPHKHDRHSEVERELEEIYYFEISSSPDGSSGFALHSTYGVDLNPTDISVRVRDGDIALVPRGYHGPCAAAPGYDLYYLNVMAGPAEDGEWKFTRDPEHAWFVDAARREPLDPRLPMTAPVDGEAQRSVPRLADLWKLP
jgi:5-deoxy-glucuronate isomerase